MALIDHLVYAVADLEAGIEQLELRLGVRAALGGAHPGMGTHNALLSLGDAYLEIIGPDPEQPEPPGPRPFGVEPGMESTLATFAVRPDPARDETIDSLVEELRTTGHDPGGIIEMSRTTPAGETLEWRLTVPTMAHCGVVPFLIDWGTTPNPATRAPRCGRIHALTGATPDVAAATDVLAALHLDVTVTAGSDGLGVVIGDVPGRSDTATL